MQRIIIEIPLKDEGELLRIGELAPILKATTLFKLYQAIGQVDAECPVLVGLSANEDYADMVGKQYQIPEQPTPPAFKLPLHLQHFLMLRSLFDNAPRKPKPRAELPFEFNLAVDYNGASAIVHAKAHIWRTVDKHDDGSDWSKIIFEMNGEFSDHLEPEASSTAETPTAE
jgi:hypothetical protein